MATDSLPTTLTTAADLQAVLDANSDGVTIIDTRLQDDWEGGHVPGSTSNCVFDVAFMGRLKGDKTAPTVVYGAGSEFHDSRMAASKLLRYGGYTNVYDFRGGMEAWESAGKAVEKGSPAPAPALVRDGTVELNLEESKVEWTGRNLLNKHRGSIRMQRGRLELKDGVVVGGEVDIDVTADGIKCYDLEGTDLHGVLVSHLTSDDFFDSERFPTATFHITGSEAIAGATEGQPNTVVRGNLTLKGVTNPWSFEATLGHNADGKFGGQAVASFDRTAWGVLYGSASFFKRLSFALVSDFIQLEMRLVTV